MTSLAAGVPVAPHTTRRAVVKVAAFVGILAASSAGLYEGAQAYTRHVNAPTASVSYASQSTIARTIAQANHTPAHQGAFLTGADISGGDVRSVVKAVR